MPPKETPRTLIRGVLAADTPPSVTDARGKGRRSMGAAPAPSARKGTPGSARRPKDTPRTLMRGILAHDTPPSASGVSTTRAKAQAAGASPGRARRTPSARVETPQAASAAAASPATDEYVPEQGGFQETPVSSRFAYETGDVTADYTTTAAQMAAQMDPTPVVGGALAEVGRPPRPGDAARAPPSEAPAVLARDGKAVKLFNPTFVSRLFASFVPGLRVSRDASAQLMGITHRYFEQVSADLAEAATRAKRARIDAADVEELFERQHLVDKQRPLEDLARELLPAEEFELIVPVALANNRVEPTPTRARGPRKPRRARV